MPRMDASRIRHVAGAGRLPAPEGVDIVGADPVLATGFPVGEVAAVVLASLVEQVAGVARDRGLDPGRPQVDVRLAAASLISFALQRFEDGHTPERRSASNPTVAAYPTADGRHVHLHGGFPGLQAGTLEVLGCDLDRTAIASAVAGWAASDLEDALASAGLCGAMVRTPDEWLAHPQGQAIEPLAAVEVERIGDAPPEPFGDGDRPLAGLRVLDLTRVLAGPTCARTLAAHGAEVLKITSPRLPFHEAFVIDTGHGKRSAHLDLDEPGDVATLRSLAAGADVFSQGYRQGALDRRGLGAADLAELRPGIVHVSVNCYGPVGPWAERPGWEQLAQAATGVMATHGTLEEPALLPAAATDYTTGYLAALGTVLALRRRAVEGGSWQVRASLAQTGRWLTRLGAELDPEAASGPGDTAGAMVTSDTPWGRLTHLAFPATLPGAPPTWTEATRPLGTDEPAWR